MKAREIVFASAEAGTDTVGTDMFIKMTQNALNMVATEVSAHVRDGENPGVFFPVEVSVDGKDRLGAILVLEDRAIMHGP